MKVWWVAISAALLLAACATRGQPFDVGAVGGLVPGQTTREEVIARVGQPLFVIHRADGGLTVHWRMSRLSGPVVTVTDMTANFAPDDKLESIYPPVSFKTSAWGL